jgi:hypothetical protein
MIAPALLGAAVVVGLRRGAMARRWGRGAEVVLLEPPSTVGGGMVQEPPVATLA